MLQNDLSSATPVAGHEPTSGATAMAGKTDAAAARLLKEEGYNELPAASQRTVSRIALEVVREPMFLLLLAAGSAYLMLGKPSDAAMLLAFVVLAMSITIYQEHKTERVLEALRDLSSPRALVMRSGRHIRIPGREVVRGDLLVLEEGDRIPADGILLDAHDLLVDESLLTGESIAVAKSVHAAGQSGADDGIKVYSGSMVVQGGGRAIVSAIGADTEIGRIGKALQEQVTERSPLQQEIGMLVKRFSIIGVVFSLGVVIVYALARGDWLSGLLAGISLAMSMLPEEFTLILAIFMALGAWRISKSQVLTRRTPVIETLGSATVLCVDKTGTLTENRMSVKAIVAGTVTTVLETSGTAPGAAVRVIEYAALASEIAPFDPMDKAFHRCISAFAPRSAASRADWQLVHEYPLAGDMMAMTHVWRVPGSERHVVAVKGAPEAVARLCRLDQLQAAALMEQVGQLAAQGMRVLAVAEAVYEGSDWPEKPLGFAFDFLGLAGLADPLRPGVRQAVTECRDAGIRVVMITGDHPATAQAIARDAGLRCDTVMTGSELDALSDAALQTAIHNLRVFARIRPEQKLRLVNAFKAGGDIVAMTGDGVNDAPALKAAHIGISMGQRGTDVAREASSLVLLNDDFSAIVHAVRLGRRIYGNLRKAMTYVVAVHLPIAGMTMLPLLFGTPLAMAPVHIVFLEMIINPACSIVFEIEHAEEDVMRRPPRPVSERLFGVRDVVIALLQGVGLLAAAAGVFFYSLHRGVPEGEARAAAFSCIVLGNLALIVGNRSHLHSSIRLLFMPNVAQWWMLGAAGLALFAILQLEVLREVFHFAPLHADAMLSVVIAAGLAAIWFELAKAAYRRTKVPC